MCGDYSSTLVNEDSHLEADYEDRSIGFGTFEDEDGDPFDSDEEDEDVEFPCECNVCLNYED